MQSVGYELKKRYEKHQLSPQEIPMRVKISYFFTRQLKTYYACRTTDSLK